MTHAILEAGGPEVQGYSQPHSLGYIKTSQERVAGGMFGGGGR